MNLRVGDFRDRAHKVVDFDIQPRDDNPKVDRAWNIPFTSNQIINELPENKGKFSWVLRRELVEAMENIMPYLKDNKKTNEFIPFEFVEFSLKDKNIKEYDGKNFVNELEYGIYLRLKNSINLISKQSSKVKI